MQFTVAFGALFCCAAVQTAAGAWSYDRQEAWPGECRLGTRQSPINIRTEDAQRFHMPEIRFNYYNMSGPFNVTGTGNTVRVEGFKSWPQRPYIDEGGLDGAYLLAEVYFRWHYEGWPVSEHSINGYHYPIEPDPAAKNIGLVDLLDMFDFMDKEFPAPPKEKTIMSGMERFRPESMLPADRARFYRYEGSTTTPNCNENVTWTVMQAPLSLDVMLAKQLFAVRMYKDSPFVYNQRRQQALNGRRVVLRVADDEPLEEPCGAARSAGLQRSIPPS